MSIGEYQKHAILRISIESFHGLPFIGSLDIVVSVNATVKGMKSMPYFRNRPVPMRHGQARTPLKYRCLEVRSCKCCRRFVTPKHGKEARQNIVEEKP